MPKRKLLEERWCRSIQQWAAKPFTAPKDVDQAPFVERLENRSSADTPYLFDLGSANWLSIGNYCQSLECGGRQTLWPRRKLSPLDRFGVLRPRQNLPSTCNLDELYSMTVSIVVGAQLFEGSLQRRLAFLGVRRDRAQIGDSDGRGAREERRFKQLGQRSHV